MTDQIPPRDPVAGAAAGDDPDEHAIEIPAVARGEHTRFPPAPRHPLPARLFAYTCTCLLGLLVLVILTGAIWRAIVWAWLG